MDRSYQLLMAVLLAALASLTGCSADDEASGYDSRTPRPLVFSVGTERSGTTRGVPLNVLTGEFGLLGAQYKGSWGGGQAPSFMYNEICMGIGSSWETGNGYLTPSSVYKLRFFAYYPYYADVATGESPIVMSDTAFVGAPYFDYTLPAKAADQQDLMYAISAEVSSDPETGRLDSVRLQFHHLLTAVSIREGASSVPGSIRKVTLTNMRNKARFMYGSEKLTVSTDYKTDVSTELNGGSAGGFAESDAGKSFLLLPGELHPSAELLAEFDTGSKVYTFRKALGGMTLNRNEHVTLLLTVESLKQMSVKAAIDDWGHGANFDGAVSDQLVIDLGTAISDWDGEDNSTDYTSGPQDGGTTTP